MLKITKNQGSIQVTADKSGFYPFDGTITFPTNSLFTATSANTDMITFKSTSNGDVQFVGNYKDITISGRSYDTKQKFLTAFSNLANQGSVDAYTKAETDAKLNDKLTAQTNANGALFISSRSNDDANNSVALYYSTVNGNGDVAIGLARTLDKKGYLNLAILNEAEAKGIQNIAIGDNRRCDGTKNVSIGCGNPNTVDVNGQGNVCIGASSQAHTPTPDNAAVNESIAIGSGASASNDYCTVIGPSASSIGSHAVAIGKDAHADSFASWSVAVGDSARAHGERSVALGYLSYATDETPLDICCGKRADNSPLRVLQSDSTGKLSILKGDGTIERMVIQDEIEALKNAGGSGGTVDAYTKAETDAKLEAKQDKLTAGSGITITKDETAGTNTIATAVSLTDNGNGAYAVGDSIKMGSDTVVIGKSAISRSKTSIAIGKSATSGSGTSNVAIGNIANSSGGSSIAIGNKTETSNIQAIAIGTLAGAYIPKSIAIGYNAKAVTDTPMVINAGGKTMIQSDANGKISLLKGDGTDERMVIQDEITALKAEITTLKAEIAALKGGASTGDTTGA